MLNSDAIREISDIFCGNTDGWYSYKTGPQLVSFFNQYFHTTDVYQSGFPSRWAYVYNKLVDLYNVNRIDIFFSLILSKEYLLTERKSNDIDLVSHAKEILQEFNRVLRPTTHIIVQRDDKYFLVKKDDDLQFMGSGGFANVYFQKSTGRVVKKLKDDFLTDPSIRSRFKREYSITKSLSDLNRIIKVYDFDEGSCFYQMEKAEKTLKDFIESAGMIEATQINCIRQILDIMTIVHERNIIHRDLSPTNIFILNGILKIADFGLGKDLNVFSSQQTIHTNGVGQYYYCAPEQFMMLREGDKRSDVYSLGRIVNFVMTTNPNNSNHMFRSVTEKATNQNSAYRYSDAAQLLKYVEKSIEYHTNSKNKSKIKQKITSRIFDEEIELYIYELPTEKICQLILKEQIGFQDALLSFMKIDDVHASHIIQIIEDGFSEVCGRSFSAYDPFAQFAYNVINENFSFTVKELAANILRYVAFDINRFNALHLVEKLKNNGLEPLIEEMLEK